jgi:hypothetical protein
LPFHVEDHCDVSNSNSNSSFAFTFVSISYPDQYMVSVSSHAFVLCAVSGRWESGHTRFDRIATVAMTMAVYPHRSKHTSTQVSPSLETSKQQASGCRVIISSSKMSPSVVQDLPHLGIIPIRRGCEARHLTGLGSANETRRPGQKIRYGKKCKGTG